VTKELRDPPQFYLTAPTPCPYLPDREERKVFTHLVGRRAGALNDALTQSGFRRSQTIAYRPACETCRRCVSVRVKTADFELSRGLRRIAKRNADLVAAARPSRATIEHFQLFQAYVTARHSEGGMADMGFADYQLMVEDSHVDTRIVEYRARDDFRLMACCLTDRLSDGLSMVYSFYNPKPESRSLGVYMILDHIAQTRAAGLEHLYLGYWVEGSPKMDYKARFLPQERLGMEGWRRVE